MKTEFIPCKPEDVAILQRLAYDTYNDTFAAMNTKETMQAYLAEAFATEKLLTELNNPDSQFYFLYANDRLAGYLKINDTPAQTDLNEPDSLEIERIYVHSNYQGYGMGRVLMDFALQKALELGKKTAWLGVWEKNLSAIAFYQKMGFVKAGQHSFRMGDELQTDWVMKKNL